MPWNECSVMEVEAHRMPGASGFALLSLTRRPASAEALAAAE